MQTSLTSFPFPLLSYTCGTECDRMLLSYVRTSMHEFFPRQYPHDDMRKRLFQSCHQRSSCLGVHDTTHPKRRYNAPYPCASRLRPILHHLPHPSIRSAHPRIWPVVQVQTQQMQWRAYKLYRRRRNELRHARRANILLHFFSHIRFDLRRKHWRQVERGEDCETVADREERECRKRNRAF